MSPKPCSPHPLKLAPGIQGIGRRAGSGASPTHFGLGFFTGQIQAFVEIMTTTHVRTSKGYLFRAGYIVRESAIITQFGESFLMEKRECPGWRLLAEEAIGPGIRSRASHVMGEGC